KAESGPIGGDLAHEFLVLAETGESEVFLDRRIAELSLGDRDIDYDDTAQLEGIFQEWTSGYARTDDTHEEAAFHAEVSEGDRVTARGIEVGHIFYFGTKYSAALGATVAGPDGTREHVHGGSYGIGVSRLVGALIEANHDDKGIIWPESVTPFDVSLVNLKQGDAETDKACEDVLEELSFRGLSVLYDDRDERAGAKFATAELIGLPWRITIGPRGIKAGTVELACRRTGESEELSADAAVNKLSEIYAGL
ncbi:MAG: His/Gly/Thr/Pro-type tRNA ligase C-terminal domain-containing protein, partial [Pseudomonadota bacterium]